MPKQTYVVKFNQETDVYLTGWTGAGNNYEDCIWGTKSNAISFETLEAAQSFAEKINSGTVGLPR